MKKDLKAYAKHAPDLIAKLADLGITQGVVYAQRITQDPRTLWVYYRLAIVCGDNVCPDRYVIDMNGGGDTVFVRHFYAYASIAPGPRGVSTTFQDIFATVTSDEVPVLRHALTTAAEG